MSELKAETSWWQTSFSKAPSSVTAKAGSFATVTRIENGYVHFRYLDVTEAGDFSGKDTESIADFQAKYGARRQTWSEQYEAAKQASV